MAKIDATIFQAASTVYQALLEAPTNRMPDHPEHALRARQIAEELFVAANQDKLVTMAAARALCGFLKNQATAHCPQHELIAWAVTGVRNLIEAFGPAIPVRAPTPNPIFTNPQPHPQMPSPLPVQPAPAPPVFAPPPVAPLDVPGFEEGGR